ncbi:MAG: hypothetical protein LBI57_01120 [Helicobacteraceae bacterium]|jgi:hypothetical protein|nr:hypothetical protein [Helicobacteraceae bacterium]
MNDQAKFMKLLFQGAKPFGCDEALKDLLPNLRDMDRRREYLKGKFVTYVYTR